MCLLACLVSLSVSTRVTTCLRLLFEPSTFPHPSHPHLPPVMTRTSRHYPCRDRSRSRSRHRSRDHSGRRSHYRSRSQSHNRRHRRDYRRRSPSNDYFRDSSSDRSRSRSQSQRRSRWSSRDCSRSRSRTRSPQRRSDRPARHRGPRHQRAQSPAPVATPLGSPPAAATSTEGRLLELLCRVIGVSQPTPEPQSNPYPTPGFYTPGGVFSTPPRWSQPSQVDHYQSSAGTSDTSGGHGRSHRPRTTRSRSYRSNFARSRKHHYDHYVTDSESEEEAPRRSRAATSRRRSSPSPPRYRNPSPSPSQRGPVCSPEQPAFSSGAHSPEFLASTSHTRAVEFVGCRGVV